MGAFSGSIPVYYCFFPLQQGNLAPRAGYSAALLRGLLGPLFQGARRQAGIAVSVVIVISDIDPLHLSARSTSTGCDSLSPRRAMRR